MCLIIEVNAGEGSSGGVTDDVVGIEVTVKLVLARTFAEKPSKKNEEGETANTANDSANDGACVR